MNIFDQLKKPTEHKSSSGATGLNMVDLKESDFEDYSPYQPENTFQENSFDPVETHNIQNNGLPGSNIQNGGAAVVNERVFDPDFTTDVVVSTIDTLQYSFFLALQSRKQKGIRFKSREEYLEAIHLNYLTETEIEKLEDPEDKKVLVQKLKAFQASMAKINEKTSFTPDEIDRLKKPIRQLVKQHNFDIPPGLALVLVMSDIISNRFIDLIMD